NCAATNGNGLARARTVGFGRPGTMLHSIRFSNASAGEGDDAAEVASPINVTDAPAAASAWASRAVYVLSPELNGSGIVRANHRQRGPSAAGLDGSAAKSRLKMLCQ